MNYNLSHLLEQKSFAQLTVDERKFVLTKLTEQVYSRQHETIVQSKEMFQKEALLIVPNPAIKANALLALKQKKKKKGGALFLLYHKIPTWSAVAAGLLLFILLKQSVIMNSNQPSNILATTDTVYVEKYITTTTPIYYPADTIVQVIYKSNPSPTIFPNPESKITPIQNSDQLKYSDAMLNSESINYTELLSNIAPAKGVSIKDDSLTQLINSTIY